MDTLASLALATEPPVPELLNRPPHSRHEYIVTPVTIFMLENVQAYFWSSNRPICHPYDYGVRR
jgi:hypothetical protein